MVQKSRSAGDPIVIKKYANRRLYNTAKSSYVTLDDLSRMVRAGDDFKVFYAKTGDEITRSVLTQIIFEEEAKGHNMLPTKFLRQLIRLYGDALQGVVPGYLDAAMEAFARNQERMRETFGSNQAMQTFEAMTRSNMELFEQTMRMFGPFAGARGMARPADAQDGENEAAPAPSNQDLDALQQQLHAMQEQLERLSQGQPPVAEITRQPSAEVQEVAAVRAASAKGAE
ncbi:MAG: polyhydroxyalkanoate synthesis repressor PhaR [Pseudomonadota bacterium]